MKIKVNGSYADMSVATADFVADKVRVKPKSLLCFPSGDTPTKTLQLLVDYSRSGKVDFSQCQFVGLDEWVGMGKDNEGSCQHYIYSNFFKPLEIPDKNIIFFDAKAADLNTECKKIDAFIFNNGPLDLVLAGVGENGHIGLNEPGSSFEWYCHYLQLEEGTKKVAQKYFSESKKLSQGITIGLQHIMESTTVAVIANGKNKAPVVKKIIEGKITENVPGSVLQRHSDCHFFLDQEAAAELQSI